MKNSKLYAKKTLSVFMAVMMLMSAWVFVPGEHNHASASGSSNADAVATANRALLNSLSKPGEVTLSTKNATFHFAGTGDQSSHMTSSNLTSSNANIVYTVDVTQSVGAGAQFSGVTNADQSGNGVRVWYPETVLMYDGKVTPKMPILLEVDSNGSEVRACSCTIVSGANGLSFLSKDGSTHWKGEAKDDSCFYYIMYLSGTSYCLTSDGTTTSSVKYGVKSGDWKFFANHLVFNSSMNSGEWVRKITPTWRFYGDQSASSYWTGTTNKSIYVVNVKGYNDKITEIFNTLAEVKNNPSKYTTASVQTYVDAIKGVINASPANYNIGSTGGSGAQNWDTAIRNAVSTYNTAVNNLTVAKYTLKFVDIDGNVDYSQDYNYGSPINVASIASGLTNTVKQIAGNDGYHSSYTWDSQYNNVSTIVDDITVNEVLKSNNISHTYGTVVQGDTTHSWTCSGCGYVKTENHVRDAGVVNPDKPDTCTESGEMIYNCSTCGKTDIAREPINKIDGHNFTGDWVSKEGGKDGSHYQKCSRCDAYGLNIDGVAKENETTVHNWGSPVVVKSTCETKGSETYTCKQCNETYTVTLELAKHTTVKTEAVDVSKICGGEGNLAFWTCSVCDRVWTDAELTAEVTDLTDADGNNIPDTLETTGPAHDFTGAYSSVSSGKDGEHYRACAFGCGEYGMNIDGVATEAATEKHNWGEPVVVDSTCTKEGSKQYKCTDCGQTYTEALGLSSHTMTKTEAVEATCTTAGNNEYYYCSACKVYFKDAAGTTATTVDAEKVNALGHTFAKGNTDLQQPEKDELISAATCQSAAVYQVTCDICDTVNVGKTYSYGEADKANGHKFDGEIKNNADGSHSYKCTVEGCSEYGATTTCDFSKLIEDTASTCKTYGKTVYQCTTCKNTRETQKNLDSSNHEGEEEIIGRSPATCVLNGSSGIVKCLGCGAEKSKGIGDIPVDSKNHEDMKDYKAVNATCQAPGNNAYRYCSACKTYEVEKVVLEQKAHKFTTYISNGDGTHTATCDTCKEEVAPRATDTSDCSGGTANCVDKKVCEVCNTAYGEIASDVHKKLKTIDEVPATCQVKGKTEYQYCSACDTNITAPADIDCVDHTYGAWTSNGNGTHTKACTTCVDTDELDIATVTADCNGGTANCVDKAVCADCKKAYGETDADNHKSTVTTLKDKVAATCQAEGFSGNYRYDCCNAIAVAGEAIEKAEHQFTIEVEEARVDSTCLKKGSATYKCSTCVETEDVKAATRVTELEINPKNHETTETTKVNAVEPTCESDGNTGDIYYVCCYDAEKTDAENKNALKTKGTKIKANGQHVYGDAVAEYLIDKIVVEKDENGKVIGKQIVLKTTEPTYEDKVKSRNEDGKWYHVQICTLCYTETKTACYTYEHTYNCVDTDICEVCDGLCSLKSSTKHKDDLVVVEGTAATCMSDGTKDYYKCADCNKTYFDDAGKKALDLESDADKAALVISKETVAHSFDFEGEATTTVVPTCEENGYEEYTCTVEGCNATTKVTIPSSSGAHVWATEYTIIKEPTCGKPGYKAIKCTLCDKIKSNSNVVVPATGDHDYDADKNGVVDKDDAEVVAGENCQKPGTLTYTCQNEDCGYTDVVIDTEGVSAHSWSEWTTIGGDCASGVVQKRECSVCGVKEQQSITTDTHQFEVIKRLEPTTETDGYEIKKCKNCGLEEKTIIESGATDNEGDEGDGGNVGGGSDTEEKHEYNADEYRIVKEKSCTTAEIREYTCLHCGEKIQKAYGEKADHVWLEQAAEKPTCEKNGHSVYYRCVRCRDTLYYVEYEKTGHTGDSDGDGRCDSCGGLVYDKDGVDLCACMCHSSGFMAIIYKIARFFWKLFGTNSTCGCGVSHY